MRAEGERSVKWFRYYDAVVELINSNPGSVDSDDRPFMFTSVTFPRHVCGWNLEAEELMFPRYSLVVAAGREYKEWESEFYRGCSARFSTPIIGSIYSNDDIARCTWDYMHLGDNSQSWRIWGIHAKKFVDAVILGLEERGLTYYVECERCSGLLGTRERFDVSLFPEGYEWQNLHEKCGRAIAAMTLHNR